MSGTQYKIRCSEVLRDALKAAGADVVRGVLEDRFLSEEQRRSQHIEVPAAIVEAVRRLGAEKAMEMMFPVKTASYAVVDGVVVPPLPDANDLAWGLGAKKEDFGAFSERIVAPAATKHPLEDEVTESGAPSWPGPYGGDEEGDVSDSVPVVPARAAYVPQRAKVFSRTPEEQAEKLKKLEGLLGLGGKDENREL